MSTYLQKDEGLTDKEKLATILEQGKALLASALPSIGIEPEASGAEKKALKETNGVVKGNGTEVVKIIDVHSWKAGMTVSPAARPMRDLSEFEEGASKL